MRKHERRQNLKRSETRDSLYLLRQIPAYTNALTRDVCKEEEAEGGSPKRERGTRLRGWHQAIMLSCYHALVRSGAHVRRKQSGAPCFPESSRYGTACRILSTTPPIRTLKQWRTAELTLSCFSCCNVMSPPRWIDWTTGPGENEPASRAKDPEVPPRR